MVAARFTCYLTVKSGPLDKSSRFFPGVLAVPEYLGSVHEYVHHALGQLVWFLKSCPVPDPGGIKHNHVGEITRRQHSTIFQFQVGGGKVSQPTDGFFHRYDLFVPYVFAQQAGKSTVASRVWL